MRVERLQREFEIDVEWWPFELHPEIPLEGIDRSGRNSERRSGYLERLSALAAEDGLDFRSPTRVPNSRWSLEAAEFAREQGAFAPYHRALFEAYFSQGRDIGDVDVLAELAVANGLDDAALREALTSRRYASLVEERTDEARQWGVSGTPTAIFESGERRFALVGAQEYGMFENVARRFGAAPRTD